MRPGDQPTDPEPPVEPLALEDEQPALEDEPEESEGQINKCVEPPTKKI